MCDPHGNTTFLSHLQNNRTQTVLVYMHNSVLRICPKKEFKLFSIADAPRHETRQTVDLSTERFYLIIIISSFVAMDQKIKLNLITINMPIIIHKHSFKSASIHVGHNLKNTNRITHTPSSFKVFPTTIFLSNFCSICCLPRSPILRRSSAGRAEKRFITS